MERANLEAKHAIHKKVLSKYEDFGILTYFRFEVELKKTFMKIKCTPSKIYSAICRSICSELSEGKLEAYGCFMSCRVKEDHGYLMDSPLQNVTDDIGGSAPTLFENNVNESELLGKFTLELLLMDEDKFDDMPQLFDGYVTNINRRLKDFPDTSVEDNIKNAHKWLNLAKMKLVDKSALRDIENDVAPDVVPPCSGGPIIQPVTFPIARFPRKGKTQQMFVERYCIAVPPPPACGCKDRQGLVAVVAHNVFRRSCAALLERNTHTMFEFLTHDGHRIVSRLRRHDKNRAAVIASDVIASGLGLENLFGMCVVTFYAVEVPAFAYAKYAQARLNFLRRSLEGVFRVLDKGLLERMNHIMPSILPFGIGLHKAIMLDECTEPLEKNCQCNKLHISDCCIMGEFSQEKNKNVMMARLLISPTQLYVQLAAYFTAFDMAADLYARIAYRLSQNTFSQSFVVGANLLFQVDVGQKCYCSQLRHHSDVRLNNLALEIFGTKHIESPKEIVITVYLVDILRFATNEKARECLEIYRLSNLNVVHADKCLDAANTRGLVTGNDAIAALENFSLSEQKIKASTSDSRAQEASFVGSMDTTYFKMGSNLATMASTEPVNIGNAYKIHSTRSMRNTTKNRILVFKIELNKEIFDQVRDAKLLVANVCLYLAGINGILLLSGKQGNITLKFSYGAIDVEVVLKDDDRWNPLSLKKEIFRNVYAKCRYVEQFQLKIHYSAM